MAVQPQKKKTVCLMRRTDEKYMMTANDLAAALQEYGFKTERKSIYADVEAVQQFELDIV